jgi:hypothetical protein
MRISRGEGAHAPMLHRKLWNSSNILHPSRRRSGAEIEGRAAAQGLHGSMR